MFSRAETLGTVAYKGQRALIVAALTNPKFPKIFSLNQVVAAINREAYENSFKHGKMAVTIPASVQYHLRELVKLGQLVEAGPAAPPEAEREELTPAIAPGLTTAADRSTQLLTEWEEWEPSGLPFVLNADRDVLESAQSSSGVVNFGSWHEAISDPTFGQPSDIRLHLGLLPQPFIGDVRRASIYILSLNPGLAPTDYYGEYKVPDYRNALLVNLKQRFDQPAPPFLFLDPSYSWHGGFRWWHGRLAQVITQLADSWGVPFSSARATLAAKLASIELLPYHSSVFRHSGGWLQNLRSVALAKTFVMDFVLPRVKRREAIAVVLRKAALWGVPEISGVTQYKGGQARAAHLTPDSPGGRAILEQFLRAERNERS